MKVRSGWVGAGSEGTQPLPNTDRLTQRSMCAQYELFPFSHTSYPPVFLMLTHPASGRILQKASWKKKIIKIPFCLRHRQLSIWRFHLPRCHIRELACNDIMPVILLTFSHVSLFPIKQWGWNMACGTKEAYFPHKWSKSKAM